MNGLLKTLQLRKNAIVFSSLREYLDSEDIAS